MPSTYTSNLGIELPADGELDGVWGDVVNDNMNILDRAINGSVALTLSGTTSTLTTSDGALSDGQYKLLVLGGSPSGTHTITIAPNDAQKIYFVRNTTAQSVVFTQGSGGNVTVATGDSAIIYSDGAGAGAAVVNITNDFAMSSVKITGGTIDGTVIGGTSAAAGTFTTATATTGNITTVNATTVDTTNIEVTTLKAKDGTSAGSIADSTGVVTLASSVLTTTDINGGTIDGTTIGGSSAAAGTFTTATATTGNITTVNATTVDTTNIEVTTLKAKDGTSAGSIADSTGVVTLASSVLTTTDINGGTIDGAVIGGSSAAAGTFTTATATTGNITTVNATTVDTTNIEVTNIKAKDGTASATIADTTGVMTIASAVLTTADINGGTIDGATIGGSSAAAVTGTTITGTSFVSSGDMTFGDNDKAIFGAGSDLQIYHNGLHSYINEGGTGNLRILAENFTVRNPADNESIIIATPDSGVTLYFDNAAKIATTATGVDVTGDVGATTGTFSGDLTISDKIVHSGDTNTAIRFPAVDTVTVETAGTERLRVDSSGNVGIGVTPSAWGGTSKALQFSTGGIEARSSALSMNTNAFFNGTNWIYSTSANAALYNLTNTGQHQWYTAPSGTAGDAITFTQAMTLDADGDLGIGTSSPGAKLELAGGNAGLGILAATNRLRFTDSDPTLVSGQTTGAIEWYTSDTDAPGVHAYIGTLGSNTGAAALTFGTGVGGSTAERMRIDASGNVGIGTSSPGYLLHVQADASPTIASTDTTNTITTIVNSSNTAGVLGTATNHPLALITNNTERARIDDSGVFSVGCTALSTTSTTDTGAQLGSSGAGNFFRASNTPLIVMRQTNDGTLVDLRQGGASEGSISVSGTTVSYNGGHLSRWAQFPDNSRPELLKGTVMSNLDQMSNWDGEDNEQLNCVQVSTVEGDANVAGVFVAWDSTDDGYNDILLAMTGDMVIRIGAGVTVARGDLLMSAGDGTAKPQGDDIVRSKTIAKVTSTHVSHTYADGSYAVPCVLMAC